MKSVLYGIVLIVFGIVIALSSLEIIDFNLLFDGWWTLFILVPCGIGLFTDDDKTGDFIGVVVGVVLLLACQGVFAFEYVWKLILPAILVILGLSLIFKNTVGHKLNQKIKEMNAKLNGSNEYFATFAEQKVKVDDEFEGSSLLAIFGGIDLDLTKAKLKKEQIINVTAVFGGVDVFVPEGVTVKVRSTSIFGGVEDKRKHVDEKEADNIIYINAVCVFGGVDIK